MGCYVKSVVTTKSGSCGSTYKNCKSLINSGLHFFFFIICTIIVWSIKKPPYFGYLRRLKNCYEKV